MPKPVKKLYKQHAPFSIQIELVEGCSLACTFCGINGIRKGPGNYKFAELSMLEKVAKEIARLKWTPRIEFAVHGEPSLHPKVAKAIECFRKHLPKLSLMMTSNGTGFLPPNTSRIPALFKAGLNVLALDDYVNAKVVGKVKAALKSDYPGVIVKHYPNDTTASIHQKRKPDVHEVVIVEDISVASEGNHSKLFNHAGCAFPKDYEKENQRCAFPFRELTVRWDGNVALCCDDFRGVYKIANVNDMPLDELWEHPRFVAARKLLYAGRRDFGVCWGCNATSYRVGLLPDPTGQETLPLPSKADITIADEAVDGKPFTIPVLRPWEKKQC